MRRPNRRRNLSRSIPPLPQTDSLAASNGNRAQDSRPEQRWYMPPLLLDWQRISFYENRRDARRDRPAWCDPCNPPGACHGIRSPFCVKCLIIKTARALIPPDEQQRNRKREGWSFPADASRGNCKQPATLVTGEDLSDGTRLGDQVRRTTPTGIVRGAANRPHTALARGAATQPETQGPTSLPQTPHSTTTGSREPSAPPDVGAGDRGVG